MTPQFLREEAARFRGMADASEREASKLRLLAMAADYEARATAVEGGHEPTVVGASEVKPEKLTARARLGIQKL